MKQVYMAKDGTIFHSEIECRNYERTPHLAENTEIKKQIISLIEANPLGYTSTDLLNILRPMNLTKKRLTVQRITALITQLKRENFPLIRVENKDSTVSFRLGV